MKYLLISIVLLLSCKKETTSKPLITNHSVYYMVTGTTLTADVSYLNGSGATIEDEHITLPYTSPTYALATEKTAWIKVKNFNDNKLVRIHIYVDGQNVKINDCNTANCEVEVSKVME